MNLLIIGGGGREHALAWKLAQSPRVEKLYAAPGNAGTARLGENLPLNISDHAAVAEAARRHRIDLVVVGPEIPLAEGLVDDLERQGIPAFGPTRAAAEIETSKVFAKDLMRKYGIPCARSRTFSSLAQARDYVMSQSYPLVVKADGLAAGKGAVVCPSHLEALRALHEMMAARALGPAGDKVVIEEFLEGPEVSLLAFSDGQTVVPMAPACDYKRALDGDQGPNTGGMGGYSPPGFFSGEMAALATRTISQPAIAALAKEGRPFKGVLYAGLIVTQDGPRALEFNARFGDPETQVMLPRLKTDLLEVLLAVVEGRLSSTLIEWRDDPCLGVVLASGGYPGNYPTGFPITGWDRVDPDIAVFHAGTRLGLKGEVLTNGGRVLTVTALGKTLAEARNKAYLNVPCLKFQGCHFRTDIAAREAGPLSQDTVRCL